MNTASMPNAQNAAMTSTARASATKVISAIVARANASMATAIPKLASIARPVRNAVIVAAGPNAIPKPLPKIAPKITCAKTTVACPSPSASSTKIAPLAKSAKTKSASMRPFAYFDFDEATIRSDAKSTIEENAQCLKSRSDVSSLQVVGHCDERGTEEYNMALGKRRADAVKSVISRLGVKKVTSKSRGAMDPVVSGASSESEHQRNRRAEFIVNQ